MQYVVAHTGTKYIENNTWALGDTQFPFECSTRYLTTERSERMSYRVENEKKNSLSKQPTISLFIM